MTIGRMDMPIKEVKIKTPQRLRRDRWRLLVEYFLPDQTEPILEDIPYRSFVRAQKAYAKRLKEIWISQARRKGEIKSFRIGVCNITKVRWQSPAIYYAEGSYVPETVSEYVSAICMKVERLKLLLS